MEQQAHLEASALSDDTDEADRHRHVYRWLANFLDVLVPGILDAEAAHRNQTTNPDPSLKRDWNGGSDFMASDSGEQTQ